ncbi:MAG: 3-dehydroquinate dehydratase [Thermoleophilia bacterium]|nr:3-dehydroquinate dehydratase [Thermoleophilia bacterium]
MNHDQGQGATRPTLVVLHGVNLDLLGERPAEHYGTITLAEIERTVAATAVELNWECVCHQTNHEGAFVEFVHRYRRAAAVIVNPGAWTHYSYAIRDALELVSGPVAEVHLSEIDNRENWRRVSVIADVVSLRVSGRGVEGYVEATRELIRLAGVGRVDEAVDAAAEGV